MKYFISKQQLLTSYIQNITLDKCIEYINTLDTVAFDSETTGFSSIDDKLVSIQLGDSINQYVIDCTHEFDYTLIKSILETKVLIMHNAQFDLRFLYKHNIYPTKIYDTFLNELVLTTGIYSHHDSKVKLVDLTTKYCNTTLNKAIRGEITKEGLTLRVIDYAAEDIRYLHIIMEKQLEQLKEHDLTYISDLENNAVKVFARMSHIGVKLNTEKWLTISNLTKQKVKELESKLDTCVINNDKLSKFIPDAYQQSLFGYEERRLQVNWTSPAQKLSILQTLGLPIDSTNDKILQKYASNYEIVNLLRDYTMYKKLNTSFGKDFLKFVNKKTGRIHSNYWQILRTGRIAVNNPNLNQIPRKGDLGQQIRAAFIPQEDYKIVGGDYSNFELRIIAELSNDPFWIKAFVDNHDLHSELCAKTFNISLEDVKKPFPQKPDITYRDVQKTINFGLTR